MRILVTGSEGFIGSNLTKLDSDVMFETLDKKGDPDHLIDLTRVNWDDFKLAKFQAVIHLAAEISVEESFQRREHYWETNVVATKNLFQACALASVPRIIFASSAAVYGPSGEPVKYVQHKPQPQSPYAETKVRGEEIGNLVSNEIVSNLIEKYLSDKTYQNKIIFDGYPRTLIQAQTLNDSMIKYNQKIHIALRLTVSLDTIIKRIKERSALEKRDDDSEEIAIKRYETYEKNIKPVIDFYKQSNLLKDVNGESSIIEINNEISALIESIKG